jgi:hypothetical protein
MSDDDTQVDRHGFTRADHDAAVEWWRRTQHRGVWYQQPRIKNRPLRNSFTIPDDVVEQLGGPKTAGAVLHGMFGLRPFTGEGNPLEIDPDVVADVGHGSIKAGRRVLDKWIGMVRQQSREGVTLEHDGLPHDDGHHGWSVRR